MRIAIDLQACQQGQATAFSSSVAALRTLLRAIDSAGHTALLVLHLAEGGEVGEVADVGGVGDIGDIGEFAADITDRWRHALQGEPAQLHLFVAPAGTDAWRHSAARLLRATQLRDLEADVVWLAGQPGHGDPADGSAPMAGIPEVHDHADASLHAMDTGLLLERLLAAAAASVATAVTTTNHAAQPASASVTPAANSAARPRLAYLSPLPPQPSGIADYSVELLAQLEQFYAIELIVDGPLTAELAARYPVRDMAWFAQHGGQFDRRLYHFGNNGMHCHLFALLQQHPGIVVLHDFFLSALLDKLEVEHDQPHAFLHALYASHGYTGLQADARLGRNAVIWAYPCNKQVLDRATGVIVHSDFSRRLARRWYGDDSAARWQVVPLIRGLRPAAAAATNAAADVAVATNAADADNAAARSARASARAALGVADDAFLLCSFGMMGVTKLDDVLIDAFLASPLATDPRCQLVFVGARAPEEYGAEIAAKIAASGVGANIRNTGFVSADDYARYLMSADLAVQLRSQTRGETSASLLDCLLYGLPTVANAHGANADLPADVLVLLADSPGEDQDHHGRPGQLGQLGQHNHLGDPGYAGREALGAALAAALTALHGDAVGLAALGARARAWMAAHHAPAQVGPRFRQAIETITARSPASHYAGLLQALRQLPPAPPGALVDTAAAIVANRLPTAPRQLLVDVSAVVQTDLRTGIQRVVRSILLGLIETPPAGFRIEPVYSTGGGRPYRYARAFTFRLLGIAMPPRADGQSVGAMPASAGAHQRQRQHRHEHEQDHARPEDPVEFDPLEDAPVDVRAGDRFLGLDLFTTGTAQNRHLLLAMRRRGVQVHFVVYDLLPLLRPEWFPAGADRYFADYLHAIATIADGLVCISRAVADQLYDWLARHAPGRRATPLQLSYFHLGADLDASAPSTGLPAHAEQVMAAIASRPSLLMVGTLEPRKGQVQALAACTLLWQQGVDVNLVVVGKLGWMVDTLARQLRDHPERGRRLFWLDGVSDQMLGMLYGSCSALLAASTGEGFGLPLIEAAQHGLPIIARDLPVFQEVGGAHASYFSGTDAAALATALRQWLQLYADGKAPASSAMPWLTWRQSTAQLLQALAGQRPYRTLVAAGANPNHADLQETSS